ncbi:DET1- and DDB1-associated protein 1-like [Uloborus diversus]|uniref:DET1- and DDB1-associated protein 1-like n=1 Tax=Uloborus diversus TaxID=327109 RepID=UPI002409ADAF|nr:DET1- and DDB1-associated protein 1-like [Uloborus diversus]
MAASEKICKVRLNLGSNSSVPYSQLLDLRSAQSLNGRTSMEGTADFLKGLPSHDENNFSRFQPDTSCKNYMKKTSVYVPTKDHPAEQIITTEKTTILLRYLQQQYDRKRAQTKRESESAGPSGAQEQTPRKKTRL